MTTVDTTLPSQMNVAHKGFGTCGLRTSARTSGTNVRNGARDVPMPAVTNRRWSRVNGSYV